MVARSLSRGAENGAQLKNGWEAVPDPKQPLPFAALASQKNYMSLYMMSVYCGCVEGTEGDRHSEWFREAWAKTGRKPDMGKSCIRFKKVEDLAPEVIGEAVRRVPVAMYVEFCESGLAKRGKS